MTGEDKRLAALKKYNRISNIQDGSFDTITRLTAKLLNVPVCIALLVDKDVIWLRSRYGTAVSIVERSSSFSDSAVLPNDLYMVNNREIQEHTFIRSFTDENFNGHFYAAVPLRIKEGDNLGALVIIDNKERILSPEERDLLREMAALIVVQLELRLKAANATFLQNQILNIAAHELRNPLTTITLSAGIIQDGNSDEQETKLIGATITRAAGRMAKLINELLESAKREASEITLVLEPVDLTAIINRIAAFHLLTATTKSQKISLNINCNPIVKGDEVRLSEVVDNLVSNAVKYSPPQSVITISLNRKGSKVHLAVSDEGPGFTEKDKENLFLPFTRLSAQPTAGEISTGLGLSIVKLLVDAHGGNIAAENNKGKGAVFIVQLDVLEFI